MWRMVVAAVAFAICGAGASAKVIFVDAEAPLGGDGASWVSAYRFLQDAVAVTEPFDEIRIAEGVYYPDESELAIAGVEPASKNSVITVKVQGLVLKGGFAGRDAAEPGAWNPQQYQTVISGDLANDDGPSWDGRADNAFTLVQYEGPPSTDATSELDTISRAPHFVGLTFCGAEHGAVHLLYPRLSRFEHCRFESNRNRSMHGDPHGGAISALKKFIEPSYTPTIDLTLVDCRFENNFSRRHRGAVYTSNVGLHAERSVFVKNEGGAVWLSPDSEEVSGNRYAPLRLVDSTFRENFSGATVGAVWAAFVVGNYGLPDNLVAGCEFIGNVYSTATLSIAALNRVGSVPPGGSTTVRDTLFRDNGVTGDGEESTIYRPIVGLTHTSGPIQIENVTIEANRTTRHIMVLEGSADFRNVVIANNSPTYQLLRLMPFRDQTARFTFEQCVLAHDGPLFSHGCFNYDCAIQIDNSTLVANDIGENEYVLGRSVTTVDARNSIFIWDDPDRLFSAPVLSRFDWCLFDNTGAASAQPAVSGSDNLYGSASLLPGTFRLTSDSPAIDAGAPDPAELLADLAGRLRVFDGDGDGAARVDIGAYEFAAPSFGDVNCDNAVNYFDIDPFVIALLDADTYAAQFPACDALTADMNQDGVVNYFDLDPFVTRLTRR